MKYLSEKCSVYAQVIYVDEDGDDNIMYDCLAANLDQAKKACGDYINGREHLFARYYHLVRTKSV